MVKKKKNKASLTEEQFSILLPFLLHEMSNPLNVSLQATKFALVSKEKPDMVEEHLAIALAQQAVMTDAMKFLKRLVYPAVDFDELEAFELSCVKDFLNRCSFGESKYDSDGCWQTRCNTSALGLSFVILNILKNALEASEPSNKPLITISEVDEFVSLSITDFGKGMSEIQVSNYGAIPTIKTEDGNEHGLGNSIVKTLCDMFDYDLSVTSAEGVGTTITVCIPKE